MPESIPASLIVETLRDTFHEAQAELAAEVTDPRKAIGFTTLSAAQAQP
jgi:hypothetical protein